MRKTDAYLLDTCAMIWATQFVPISDKASAVISRETGRRESLHVSAMSAWEIGMLVAKDRLQTTKSPLGWFVDFVVNAEVDVLAASPEILVASSFLPQPVHNDPTDRILIATAREHDLTIITRDRAILSYGEAGHVRTLAC